MKKLSLIVILLSAVIILQKCKKDTYTATATSTNLLFAVINDTTWNADTIQATLTYHSATKTKIFTCNGIAKNKKVQMTITASNASGTASFPLTTFNADAAGKNTFAYYAYSSASGFVPQGTVAPGSGTVTFTAIDSVKMKVSGIFSYLSEKTNYDNKGNIISVTINQISAGAFNSLPYTFTSN